MTTNASYVVTLENLSQNIMTFANRFDAFEFIRTMWSYNPEINIQMVSVDTGWVHDLSFLKSKSVA